jgi:Ca2+-binding EF-hand superfamily protein
MTDADKEKMFKEMDTDSNGQVSKEEFKKFWSMNKSTNDVAENVTNYFS